MPQSPEQMRAFSPDAHIAFRSLPQQQQLALLSHYTGTSNMSSLQYAANMARNDPHLANRVMEQMAAGAPELMQIRDNSIGSNIAQEPVQPQAPASTSAPASAPTPAPASVSESTPASAPASAPAGTVSVGEPELQVIGAAGLDDGRDYIPPVPTQGEQQRAAAYMARRAAEKEEAARSDESALGIAPGIGFPGAAVIQYLTQGDEGSSWIDTALAALGFGAGTAAVAEGIRARRGASSVEADISDNIDVQDRVAERNFPEAQRPAVPNDVPEPPIQVGHYAIGPDMTVIDVSSGQVVPEEQGRELLMRLARYMREGASDASLLTPFGVHNQRLDTILSPDDHTRLQRLLQGEGPLGTAPMRTKKGTTPKYRGKVAAPGADAARVVY